MERAVVGHVKPTDSSKTPTHNRAEGIQRETDVVIKDKGNDRILSFPIVTNLSF
jgi:hypothetical protein